MLVCPAAFAAALGAGEHPVFDQAADRRVVATPVGEHLLAALHSEGIKALAAQLQQLVALGVAQLSCCAEAFGYAAHQVVGASLVAGDAIEGEPCPPSVQRALFSNRSGTRPPPGSAALRLAPGRGVTGGGTCSLTIPLPLAMPIQVCWPREQLGPCHAAW